MWATELFRAKGNMTEFRAWFQNEIEEGRINKDVNPADCVHMYCGLQADAVRAECEQLIRLKMQAWEKERVGQQGQSGRAERGSGPTDYELKKESRDVLRSMGKSITVSDGNDKGALRVWLESIDRAGRTANAEGKEILRFALANSRGDLQKVVFAAWEKLGDKPWSALATEIANTLLTADEESYLRDRVTNMFQLKGETDPNYCRRYWDAVYKAWPKDQMNKQILTMLLSQFADSLREVQTRWHVKVNSPDTVEEAIRLASSSGRALESRRHRIEEEMEIGEIKIEKNNGVYSREENTVRTLQGEIKGLCRKIQKCEEVAAAREDTIRKDLADRENNNKRAEKRYMDGRVKIQNHPVPQRPPFRCYGCGGPHMLRECPTKPNYNRWRQERRGGYATQGAAHSGN